jgi:hypothetical protein
MESFFSTVKFELGEHFASCGEAKRQLFDYLEMFYNARRRHSTIGNVSPAIFERNAVRVTSDADGVARGIVPPTAVAARASWSFPCSRA